MLTLTIRRANWLCALMAGLAAATLTTCQRHGDVADPERDQHVSLLRLSDGEPGHSLHQRGLALLRAGKAAEAANTMVEAVKRAPANAGCWNDLAVARFEGGKRHDDPRLFASALAAADRALRLQASHSAAAYNRAQILTVLQLRGPAAMAWRRFLTLDSSSKWSVAGRAQLRTAAAPGDFERWREALPELEGAVARGDERRIEQLVRAFPLYSRTWSEGEYLARWGEALLAGKEEDAQRALAFARAAGARLAAVNGEELLRDAVAAIDEASPRAAHALARAHVDYRTARRTINDREPSRAIDLLVSAERQFAPARSPMALVARYYRAGALVDNRDVQEALRLLDDIETRLEPGFVALRAQVAWERARAVGRAGDAYACLIAATEAARLFERLGEHEHAARTRTEAAVALTTLGRFSDAWRMRLIAFGQASASGRPVVVEAVLHGAARDEILERRHEEAASLFQVMAESPAYSPRLRFDAALWQTWLGMRAAEQPSPSLAALRNAAAAVPDALRADAEDEIRFAEALLLQRSNPSEAMRLSSRSIEFRRTANREPDVIDALVVRARAARALKDDAAARRDLEEALALLERQRERVETRDLRDSFFDTAGETCRQLVELHAGAGDASEAFDVAERCRARAMLDIVSTRATPLQAAAVQRLLPPDTTILHYTAIGPRVVVIALSRSRVRAFIGPFAPSYDALIEPVADSISGDRIVIVADEVVGAIPFAALRRGDGRYLMELHEIAVAPSASTWIARHRREQRRMERVVAVGDPAFSAGPLVHLDRLPAAAREARQIAALHHGSTLLTGEEATIARFRESAADSDVVHLATHALVDARDARASALLLAPDSIDSGMLTLKDVLVLPLRRAPVVILAGCNTGTRGGGRGTITSLAAAFVTAGASSVVASLRDVDDVASLHFAVALHRRLRTGQRVAAAMRETQQEMAASPDPRLRDVRTWGSFYLYGFD